MWSWILSIGRNKLHNPNIHKSSNYYYDDFKICSSSLAIFAITLPFLPLLCHYFAITLPLLCHYFAITLPLFLPLLCHFCHYFVSILWWSRWAVLNMRCTYPWGYLRCSKGYTRCQVLLVIFYLGLCKSEKIENHWSRWVVLNLGYAKPWGYPELLKGYKKCQVLLVIFYLGVRKSEKIENHWSRWVVLNLGYLYPWG